MALHNLNINFNLILFADDTSVSISEPSNKILCNSLNLVILNLHEWFTNNRLILNIDKTKVLPKIFRRKDITLTRNRVIRICIQNTLVPPIAGYF